MPLIGQKMPIWPQKGLFYMALHMLLKNDMEKSRLFGIICTVTCGLILFFAAGCEDNTVPDTLNHADPVGALTISPSSVMIGADETFAVFTANGGTPPYSWSVSDSTLGSVPQTDASTVTYTRTGTTLGANTVRVVDRNSWVASAVVSQTTNNPAGP